MESSNEIFEILGVDKQEGSITMTFANEDGVVYRKQNFLNKDGEFILDKWYDIVSYIDKDFIEIIDFDKDKKAKIWFVNEKGEELFKDKFDKVYGFMNDCILVEKDGKYNYINKEGRLICDQWYDYGLQFDRDGYGRVFNGKMIKIDKEGNEIK